MSTIYEKTETFLRLVQEDALRGQVGRNQTYSRSRLLGIFNAHFGKDPDFSEAMDLLAFHRLMDAEIKDRGMYDRYYITDFGYRFLVNPMLFLQDCETSIGDLQERIDSTDWTGLSKAISPEHRGAIRERASALMQTIIQSDADIKTRTDACKRVEAVIVLLEAPNVPWREVVNLLNNPAVTALFAGLSLIQFIIGLAA